eukprot:2257817-Pleurochrysis_carterae.AAC.1
MPKAAGSVAGSRRGRAEIALAGLEATLALCWRRQVALRNRPRRETSDRRCWAWPRPVQKSRRDACGCRTLWFAVGRDSRGRRCGPPRRKPARTES